jgi:hypothetical protein
MWRAYASIDPDVWVEAIGMPARRSLRSTTHQPGWPEDTYTIVRRVIVGVEAA